MNNIIHVHTGEVKVGHANAALRSTPIGSCVVVMAWEANRRLGIMAHIMLPGCAPKTAPVSTRYAVDAIDTLANSMSAHASLADTGVCLVGAANVLKKDDDTICCNNIHSITEYLKHKNIPVHGARLGGNQRRMACLYVDEGRMTYTQGESREQTLWRCTEKTTRNETLQGESTYGRRIVPIQVAGCREEKLG